MMGEYVLAAVGLFGFGMWLVWSGLRLHLGYWRRWYLMEDTIFAARPALFGLAPAGMAVVCFSVSLLLPTLGARRIVAAYVVVPLVILAVILSFWQPKWLKPKWVCWLEENNQDILGLIIEEGRKTKDWGKVVATQEGLEAWVAQVRQKHGYARRMTPTAEERSRSWAHRNWPIGLVIVAVFSGLGQYFLGNGFIGFIVGWVILGLIYLLRPQE
jgi:hypothetical protein